MSELDRLRLPWESSCAKIYNSDGADVGSVCSFEAAAFIVASANAFAGVPVSEFAGMSLAEYASKQAFMNGMAPANGGMEISLSGMACQILAASFAGQFVGNKASNYLEVNMSHPEIGPFTVTIQRAKGKTPGQFRSEAEARSDNLLAALEWIVANHWAHPSNLVGVAKEAIAKHGGAS